MNKDGLISFPEFIKLLSCLGISEDGETPLLNADVINEWNRWDSDGNGCVDFNEFLSAVTHMLTNTDNELVIQRAFNMFDKVQ